MGKPTYEELVDCLAGMVAHACATETDELCSMAISDNAYAMQLLERAGCLEITGGAGRVLRGKWKVPEPLPPTQS